MRLMCSQYQSEVEMIKAELLKAGIPSETRPNPVAEALGLRGLELWVQNEQDLYRASKVYARFKDRTANSVEAPATGPKPETSGWPASGAKSQAEPSTTPPADVSQVDSKRVVQPAGLFELERASSLLRKGIETMALVESKLDTEFTSLRGRVEELTRALAQAQADVVREVQGREAAERKQTEEVSGLVETIERERREWQQKLKSSEDSFKNAQGRVDTLSRSLEVQQAAAMEFKCSLSDAREVAVAEREARIAAEQRASLAEETLQTQGQELEREIQAHVASLGSLLARVTGKAA